MLRTQRQNRRTKNGGLSATSIYGGIVGVGHSYDDGGVWVDRKWGGIFVDVFTTFTVTVIAVAVDVDVAVAAGKDDSDFFDTATTAVLLELDLELERQ